MGDVCLLPGMLELQRAAARSTWRRCLSNSGSSSVSRGGDGIGVADVEQMQAILKAWSGVPGKEKPYVRGKPKRVDKKGGGGIAPAAALGRGRTAALAAELDPSGVCLSELLTHQLPNRATVFIRDGSVV